jgi:RNA polymerase sigma-70 factor (ECF subfamily)
LDESVNMAFLVVLDAMTPAERVAFILHDVFRYPFPEVAEIVGRTPAACRQLASSARRRIQGAQSPTPMPPSARRAELVRQFKAAWEATDIQAIVSLLDPDVTATADGGGLVPAALEPVHGDVDVAQYFADLPVMRHGRTVLERTVNGQPGLVIEFEGVTETVIAFGFGGDQITNIWAIRNPEKLQPWTH